MRKAFFFAFVAIICLLTGCHTPAAQAQADPPFNPPVVAKAPHGPGAGATLCTPTEEVIISCRLKDSGQIASICIAPAKAGDPRAVRFAQGSPGKKLALQYVPDGSDVAPMFRRTHLYRAGPTGGYAYTFAEGGYRYGFYTEEGTYHALAGFFQAQPTSSKVISHQLCDMQTLVISYDRKLTDLTRAWQKDPMIDEYDVPLIDNNSSR